MSAMGGKAVALSLFTSSLLIEERHKRWARYSRHVVCVARCRVAGRWFRYVAPPNEVVRISSTAPLCYWRDLSASFGRSSNSSLLFAVSLARASASMNRHIARLSLSFAFTRRSASVSWSDTVVRSQVGLEPLTHVTLRRSHRYGAASAHPCVGAA